MKTKITICTVLITLLTVLAFFSCDNPLALGVKLDIDGPVVNIVSPTQRQSVPVLFDLEGTAQDYSGVDKLLIKAEKDNLPFPRQWRYQYGAWEISDDNGASWSPFEDAEWNGTANSGVWKITVNMAIAGVTIQEGEYTFNVQAWDKGEFSSDDSFKAVVLIVDLNPPKVDISYPFLYRGNDAYNYDPLKPLHDIANDQQKDGKPVWQDPSYLGKFITQEFDLKWQIEDINDVWSIDLRFYDYDTVIDNNPETGLPDNYIYKYFQNVYPPPSAVNPADYIKPNGSVLIPELTSAPGTYDGGELKNPITTKTTIKIVAVCYDAAGNPNQEKTLGYFIFWPDANTPWVVFSGGDMEDAASFYGHAIASLEPTVFTVFPGKYIKATAYQAHGVQRVEYSVHSCAITGGNLTNVHTLQYGATISNPPYSAGMYTNIFTLEFDVPKVTGWYVLKATAFSGRNKPSADYEMLFMVNDITYPQFIEGPFPVAGQPLYKAINTTNNTITISGVVDDATELDSLCLVWINPESEGFAAMSQLAYFREKNYEGWGMIKDRPVGTTVTENIQSPNFANRLWKLNLTPTTPPIDPDTNRRLYRYSQVISLPTLNISTTQQPLRSQVFLLRAENKGKQVTIITYAPQGDTVIPEIKITKTIINYNTASEKEYITNGGGVIEQFKNNDTIRIEGTWKEDSLEFLNSETYFRNNFSIEINNATMLLTNLTLNRTSPTATEGTWIQTTTVRDPAVSAVPAGFVSLANLKDTLVVDAKTKDIGGNVAETGSSWLIKSDYLSLMRISSDLEDGIYPAGKEFEIFLEFSKPVKLAGTGTLQLVLSSGGYATYSSGQTDQNSRQRFTYNVANGHNAIAPAYLNITGLRHTDPNNIVTNYTTTTPYNTTNYPFAWTRGANDEYEEVRLTMQVGRSGAPPAENPNSGNYNKGYYVRTLPTTGEYALNSAKHIEIDTTAPVITGISAITVPGYYKEGDIYMSVTFNEAVTIPTGSTPRLTLTIGSPATAQTSAVATDVRVNDRTITFKYSIGPDDFSRGNEISVSGYTGTIKDIAGNDLAQAAVANYTGTKTLGIIIETRQPDPPNVRVLSTYVDNPTASNQVAQNYVSGTTHYGSSTQANRALSNLYFDNLWYTVQPVTTETYRLASLEYSINNGTTWNSFPNTTNTPQPLSVPGEYRIIARQKDQAGNVSDPSPAVTFTWDPGPLISRISSTNANGTYTHNEGRNQIAITIYFRKELFIAATTTPQITLNALNSANNPITVNLTPIPAAKTNSITFNYTVQNGDRTPTSTYLNVTSLSGNITTWDGTSATNGVRTTITALPASLPAFDKQLTVQTGNLTQTPAPTFIENNQGGTGWNTETNANFHGIRTDDGSYWTTLQIPFDRDISKGTGNITITQSATNYRLPAVITEAQFNRLRNVANFDTYYEKGTNGYNDSTGSSDTSTKYILKYANDPAAANPPAAFTTFATAFRNAEAITVNVNAQAVTIDGNTLKIRLSGSSAPQVPGATYEVRYPVGLVTDTLGNSCAIGTPNVALRGVAKPFVRILKTQDTIAYQAPTANNPRFVATQPILSYAKIDCRTPGSAITYTATTGQTNVPIVAVDNANNKSNWNVTNGPTGDGGAAARPGNATATNYTNNSQITLGQSGGATPSVTDVQGYTWWVLARAGVGGVYSYETEEIAYRTVVTYQLRNANAAITAGASESILANGDQIWIRGGDAIGSSSIPGFPFTWEDNWDNIESARKRAGIRLMTKTSDGSLNFSLWKFVTWELNANAYVDFIRGHDDTAAGTGALQTALANKLWQYGPVQWAYQRAGWTSYKDKYPLVPGKHRWCDTGYEHQNKGSINFSGTLMARPDKTTNHPNVNQSGL